MRVDCDNVRSLVFLDKGLSGVASPNIRCVTFEWVVGLSSPVETREILKGKIGPGPAARGVFEVDRVIVYLEVESVPEYVLQLGLISHGETKVELSVSCKRVKWCLEDQVSMELSWKLRAFLDVSVEFHGGSFGERFVSHSHIDGSLVKYLGCCWVAHL